MKTLTLFKFAIILVGLFITQTNLFSQNNHAKEILNSTKINGGICLLLGAKSLDFAKDLTENSELFVQVLQSDDAIYEKWSNELATSPARFKISIRNSKFSSENYGSNLLNLIIVLNEIEIKNTPIDEICRILVPNGVFLANFKTTTTPKDCTVITNENIEKLNYLTYFQKNKITFNWEPADSLKWRAEPRAHINIGFMGLTHGSGKFVYREVMETENAFPQMGSTLIARDNFNGRTLWKLEEPNDSWNVWRINAWTPPNFSMALDDNNQFFYITTDKKLVCLDAETGKQKSVLINEKAEPALITIHENKYLLYNNSVFSTKNHQKIFSFSGNYLPKQDKLFTLSGNVLKVYSINEGKLILEQTLDWLDPKIAAKSRMYYLCDSLLLAQSDKWSRPAYAE